MRIVFIGGRDIRKIGGIENYMFNLSSYLIKAGHTPIVFCESDHNGKEIISGIEVYHVKGPKSPFICKPYVGLIATLKSVFFLKNIDVIHYNAWPPSLWSFIPRIFKIPSLMQGHGFEWKRSKYSRNQQKIMKFMERITAHLNRNLIMCSEEQTKYFAEHYKRKAVTIPTAINLPNKSFQSANLISHFNIKPHKYFLFLARLVQDKNPDYLIKAFRQINCNDFQLVIAGDNPSDPSYVTHLKDLANGMSNVIFTGAVYGKQKEELLRNAFYFCIPSTIEGLSIALLEAMSYKLPILASSIEANKEILNNDSAIWVIPEDVESLKNGLKDCLSSFENIPAMVERNFEAVKSNYTWEKITEKYLDYLRQIV